MFYRFCSLSEFLSRMALVCRNVCLSLEYGVSEDSNWIIPYEFLMFEAYLPF